MVKITETWKWHTENTEDKTQITNHRKDRKSKILLLFGVAMLIFALLIYQVPIELVVAEGETTVPEPIQLLINVNWLNFSFTLEKLELSLTLNGQNYSFYLEKSEIVLLGSKVENHTYIRFIINVYGAQLKTPKLETTLHNLIMRIDMDIVDDKTKFRIKAETYKPIYELIGDIFRNV